METIHQTVRTEFHYPVHFTRGAFHAVNNVFHDLVASARGTKRVLFVVDEGVCTPKRDLVNQIENYCRIHSEVIERVADPLLVPGGEEVKNNDEYVNLIRDAVNRHGICRHSFIAAVGGGAVLDMAGYAAATSHRGIHLVRFPTTVLSQNDSGLGVKTSINRFGKKNFLGTFTPPFAVINDFEFLDSLSDRDWRSGAAEAVKVSLIKDKAFFDWIEGAAPSLRQRDASATERLIYRCAQLHLAHISGGDPFETGSSRPLDFGHWAAHKLEQLTNYTLRHGEAVAIGIALDATYSHAIGMFSKDSWSRIINIFLELGLPVYAPELEYSDLLTGLTEFREHLGGELTILLLRDIGTPEEVHEIDAVKVRESVHMLSKHQPASMGQPMCSY
jgi:3-dehydroquinate synthase